MKRFTGTRGMIVLLLLLCMLAGYYFYLSNKGEKDEEVNATKVQEVLLRDLSRNYPATPKEVVRYYSEIMQCLYNEEYTEEEFKKLADQARILMDQELADNNPAEQYYLQVKNVVDDFREKKKTINNASVCDSNQVKYSTIGGFECAYVTSSYFVREKDGFSKSNQNFVLRKDEENRWKILAFELAEGEVWDSE